MTEERLFDLAVGTPEAERVALLDRECAGDPELRGRIEALVQAHERDRHFLEPAPRGTADYKPSPEQPGIVIGPYRLIEQIGEGGMGTVWLAHQSKPMKRNVAVKLIKVGMDSRQVLARFDAERQALALMDHPNIAKVLDGGLTADGRPFFVMELVKGVPITEYCDAHKLTPKERLELFVPVCQAIQHAHQKGIIHRDIKPSNVLIALYDDLPVPKVIDFGVAKATGATLTEETIVTGMGGPVGTPQYMSPEQASFNNLDIDTRSDVYCLGVLLYELLSGSPPFSKKDLEKKGLLEILRVIREEEPPKPSTKLSTANALPSLAAQRGTEPGKLTKLLRNELDWIVMKALEKDRAKRYESASGLARDVRRYLDDEPIEARPPSYTERIARWKRRHPRFMTAYTTGKWMGLVVLTLAVLLYLARVRAADSEKYNELSQIQRDAYSQALEFMCDSFVSNGLQVAPDQARPYLSAALERADARLEKRIATPAAREIVYREFARSYETMKDDGKAEIYWRRYNETQRTSQARRHLALCLKRQGKLSEAEQVLRDGLQIARARDQEKDADRRVLGVSGEELDSTLMLANLLAETKRPGEAADLLRAVLDRAIPQSYPGVVASFGYSGIPFFGKKETTYYTYTVFLIKHWTELAGFYDLANRPVEAAECREKAEVFEWRRDTP